MVSSIRTRVRWTPVLRSAVEWRQAPNAWLRPPASGSRPHPPRSFQRIRHRVRRHKARRPRAHTRDPLRDQIHVPIRNLRLVGNRVPSRLRGRVQGPGPRRNLRRLFRCCRDRAPNRSWDRTLSVHFHQIQASSPPPFKKPRLFLGGASVFRPAAAGSSAPPRFEGLFPPPGHRPQWPGPRPGSFQRSDGRRS